jgi:beta-lactamase class A
MHKLISIPIAATIALAASLPLRAETIGEAAKAIEAELGGRVGVMLRTPGQPPLAEVRAGERFAMMSTFKALLCGAVLARVDAGQDRLDRVIPYKKSDLVPYSPVTETHVADGMSVGDLCAAAITVSDNSAANLLLASVGGPSALTDFARFLGDEVTRLDRWETALNEAAPGDPRDTTTPAAMVGDLEALLIGAKLTPRSRTQLETWMRDDRVAGPLIRASLPQGWGIADKTGAGDHGSRGIVALIRTPDGKPWLTAIYLGDSTADLDSRNRAVRRIGKAVIETIAGH